jgi:hypothetical protein
VGSASSHDVRLLAFMVIGVGAYLATVAIPPIVNAQVLPTDLPLHGLLGGRSVSVSARSSSLRRSLDGTASLILPDAVRGGASPCAGI